MLNIVPLDSLAYGQIAANAISLLAKLLQMQLGCWSNCYKCS